MEASHLSPSWLFYNRTGVHYRIGLHIFMCNSSIYTFKVYNIYFSVYIHMNICWGAALIKLENVAALPSFQLTAGVCKLVDVVAC